MGLAFFQLVSRELPSPSAPWGYYEKTVTQKRAFPNHAGTSLSVSRSVRKELLLLISPPGIVVLF